ncbi:MAG: hypothetical protein IJD21_03135 [Oscillospiraceae bacterium]|nr:hypothetical protein [Oscillospiraceae bacterium]
MNVEIRTIFGCREFDLFTGQTVKLLEFAERWYGVAGCVPGSNEMSKEISKEISKETFAQSAPELAKQEPEPAKQEHAPAEPARPMSRKERLFGIRPKTTEPEPETQAAPPPSKACPDGHKGFLYCRCAHCGGVTGFYSAGRIKTLTCRTCGKETALPEALRRMEIRCKCGFSPRYLTNISDELVELSCHKCGAPAVAVLGSKGDYLQMRGGRDGKTDPPPCKRH